MRLYTLAILLLMSLGAAAQDAALRSGVFKPPRPAPEFTLRGSDGRDLPLSRYRGKVVALGFGYTYCPDVCPTTLHFLAQARERLGAAGQDLQVIYVTVDPQRDSAERLREYVAAFDRSFLGATGSDQALADVRRAYGVLTTRKDVAGKPDAYLMHHSSSIYLVDRGGNLRAMMPFGVSVDDIAHDAKVLLAEGGARPRVEGAWSRRAPGLGGSGNGAVYATLVNPGPSADALVSASSDAAGAVEIHETYAESGMSKMREIPKIAVPASGRVELKPGGYHVMLLNLKRDLRAGEALTLRLVFERAGPVDVRAEIR